MEHLVVQELEQQLPRLQLMQELHHQQKPEQLFTVLQVLQVFLNQVLHMDNQKLQVLVDKIILPHIKRPQELVG
jgi:hypothetical protein